MHIPENIITKLYELRDTHNQKRENRHRRVTMVTLKEVFERGVKAYEQLNEPVSRNLLSSDKKYNAGLARVKAFLYKAEKGSSYNGLYSHDNDLLDFNGISHEQFAGGGILTKTEQKQLSKRGEITETKDGISVKYLFHGTCIPFNKLSDEKKGSVTANDLMSNLGFSFTPSLEKALGTFASNEKRNDLQDEYAEKYCKEEEGLEEGTGDFDDCVSEARLNLDTDCRAIMVELKGEKIYKAKELDILSDALKLAHEKSLIRKDLMSGNDKENYQNLIKNNFHVSDLIAILNGWTSIPKWHFGAEPRTEPILDIKKLAKLFWEKLSNDGYDIIMYENQFEKDVDHLYDFIVKSEKQINYIKKIYDDSYYYGDKSPLTILRSEKFSKGGFIAPNGKPSNLTPEQYRLVRTPKFKAWFGDWENSPETASKVVDENGEPLVVYHTDSYPCDSGKHQINIFNVEQKYDNTRLQTPTGKAFYFALDVNLALEFSRCSYEIAIQRLYQVFLNVRNPSNNLKTLSAFAFDDIKEINNSIRTKDNCDGVFLHNNFYDEEIGDNIGYADQIVVFNSTQIKLADGSNTTFDGRNPDIRFEEGGSMELGGIVVNPTEIKCHKCDWKWKIKDGGNDLFICHKCHFDNSKFYKFIGLEGQKMLDNVYDKGGSIKKPKFSIDYDEDRVEISIKGIGEVILTETYPEYEFTEDISEDELSDLGIEEGDFIGKIEHLKVNDEYKGKGYAKLLMQKAIDVAKERGLMPLYLNASPMGYGGLNLSDLTSFYEGLGFRVFLHQGGNNLMIYNPDIRFKSGGEMSLSKTPAPKKERIYGSETNPEGSSSSGKAAKEITFSESTLKSIRNKIDEHNAKHPKKKVTIEVAKAVVRRGMGAYSSTHRPTIKGGRPNSRTAWGLARLNAFLYKAVNGKSKSGRYSEDNDLLDELGIKHQKFDEGGRVKSDRSGNWIGDGKYHADYFVFEFPEYPQIVSSVSKSETTESVYVYYNNTENDRKVTVRFSQHENNAVKFGDQLNGYFATKNEILYRLGLVNRKFIPGTRLNIDFRAVKKVSIPEYKEADKTIQEMYAMGAGADLTPYKGKLAKGSNYLILGDRIEEIEDMDKGRWVYENIAEGGSMELGGIFHGSPHRFDKFSTQYMGTGEGAQAFGWGLYFTDIKSIAETYGKTLAQAKSNADAIAQYVYGTGYTNEQVYAIMKMPINNQTDLIKEAYNKKVQRINSKEDGDFKTHLLETQDKLSQRLISEANQVSPVLYKVTLHKGKTPDQYTWLEWDKELSKEQVSDILNKIGIVNEESKPNIDYEIENFLRFNERTGKGLYRYLENLYNSDKEASLILLRAGIDGIKYPAESLARGATSDTARGFNYVVFDENAVTIEDVEQFAKGGAFTPPYPINKAGGYDYSGKPAKKAEEFDLLTLPRDVNGTHCGNCFFFEKGMCLHKKIMLPVTDRMCCAVWDNVDSERSYEKKLEKGEAPENTEKFPVNDRGGYDYNGKALETAEKFDLITLPKKIEGTNCANCGWFSPYKDGGYCFRPNILLPVTGRMSCKLWNSLSVKRDWSIFDEGGEIGNYIPGFKTGDEVSFIGTGLKVITAKVDFYMPPGDHSYADMYSTSRGYVKNGNLVPAVTGAKKEGSGQGYKSFRGMGGGKSYKVSFKDGYEFTASSYIDERNDAILEAIRHRINTGNYPKVESVSEKKDIPSPDLSVEKMEGRKRLDNMFAEVLMMLRETETNLALADVESTAKALEGKTKGLELPFFRGSGKKTEDIIETSKYASKKIDEKYDIVLDETEKPPFYVIKDKMGNRVSEKEFKTKNSANDEALELLGGWDKMKAEMFSEAYHKAKADGSNPELVRAVEEILSQKLTKFATENEPEKHGFTEGADLKAINEKLKKKYGEKEAAKLYQVALRLVNPNRNTIVEIRSSGVVINEGGKYIFLPFGNTDANSKNWILYKGMDVTDQFDKKDEKTEPAKPEPNPIMPDNQRELLQYVSSLLESGTATNIVNITSKAKQLNILDANKNPDRTKVKEITELAVCMVGRKLAHENKSLDDRYDNIVNLYNNQANLSFRTSESQMLQQYSTPVPIAFLAGVFCGFEKPGNYFEPSAGNGLLTVAGNPQDFTVNEIDWLRRRNLEYQGFRQVLDRDASKPFDDFKGTFDAAITNPPFGSIRGEKFIARGMPITKLEHMMAIHALDTLKNDGRCAIIIGGHTPYDSKGRIVQGSNRNFYVYLAHFYNLVDSINISGKMYSRQGTTFDVRLILIDGKKNKPEGFPPLADVTSASTEVWSVKPVMNYDEFFERMLNNINK